MGFGIKAGLVAGLATLLVTAAAVFAGGPDASAVDEGRFNAVGYMAAKTLAGTNPGWWTGASGEDRLALARKVFEDLFGDAGKEWWKDRKESVVNPDWESLERGSAEWEDAQKYKEQFLAAEEKWKAGASDQAGAARDAQVALRHLTERPVLEDSSFRVLAAWIREMPSADEEGKEVASSGGTATYSPGARVTPPGQNAFFHVDGTLGRDPVRVFAAPMGSAGPKQPALRAYVAMWSGPLSKSGGVGALGLVLVLLGPLLVGGAVGALAGGHTKAVKDLAREIDRLGASGDPARAMRAHGGEAGMLARSVERMVQNLEFRSQHGDQDLDQIVERERKVAEEIHASLMGKNPPRLSDYEVETLFKPGFEIGGDHFEYFRIDEQHVGVILLDTNVRGIPAALVMSSARSYVRSVAPGNLSPADVLRQVNRLLAGDLPPGRHVTAVYVVIDTGEGKATVASAGHLPLLVYRHASGKVAKVNPEGIALGLDVGPVFDRALQEGDIPIGVGDRIVLYTDGALRIVNEGGEEFGESRFYASVTKEAPKNSQAFVNFVGSAIDQFHLNTPQSDDITISTVKRLK
jgi:serine phosphatase RsbU (regulator of sigma subunit)